MLCERPTPSRRQRAPVASDHMVGAELQHVAGAQRGCRDRARHWPSCRAARAGSRARAPRRPGRAAALARHAAAELAGRLGEMHLIAALAERARRIRARPARRRRSAPWPRLVRARDAFGMPAACAIPRPWSGSGCSGSATWSCRRRRRYCSRCIRGCRRSRPSSIFFGRNGSAIEGRAAPMKSRMPRLDLRHHGVGRGEAADADHRLAGERLDEVDERLLAAFARRSARSAKSLSQALTLTSHRSGSSASMADDLARLGCAAMPAGPEQLVDGEAHAPRRSVADRLLGVLDHLAQQPHAVFQAAAIFVAALVVAALAGNAWAAIDHGRHRHRRCRSRRACGAQRRRRDASGGSRGCRALSMARACDRVVVAAIGWCDGADAATSRRVEVRRGRAVVRTARCRPARHARAPRRSSAPAPGCRGRPTGAPR